jgi:uncharacterized membrane protein required for colicin V production
MAEDKPTFRQIITTAIVFIIALIVLKYLNNKDKTKNPWN